jgi:hypothetical protein
MGVCFVSVVVVTERSLVVGGGAALAGADDAGTGADLLTSG